MFAKRSVFYIVTQWIILVLLVGVLAVTLYYMTRDFETFMIRGNIHATRQPRQLFAPARNLTPATPDQIRGWMTLRYINTLFALPPEYLKTKLAITDSHYPNVTIDNLAAQQKITSAQMLTKVSAAITARLNPTTAK